MDEWFWNQLKVHGTIRPFTTYHNGSFLVLIGCFSCEYYSFLKLVVKNHKRGLKWNVRHLISDKQWLSPVIFLGWEDHYCLYIPYYILNLRPSSRWAWMPKRMFTNCLAANFSPATSPPPWLRVIYHGPTWDFGFRCSAILIGMVLLLLSIWMYCNKLLKKWEMMLKSYTIFSHGSITGRNSFILFLP